MQKMVSWNTNKNIGSPNYNIMGSRRYEYITKWGGRITCYGDRKNNASSLNGHGHQTLLYCCICIWIYVKVAVCTRIVITRVHNIVVTERKKRLSDGVIIFIINYSFLQE